MHKCILGSSIDPKKEALHDMGKPSVGQGSFISSSLHPGDGVCSVDDALDGRPCLSTTWRAGQVIGNGNPSAKILQTKGFGSIIDLGGSKLFICPCGTTLKFRRHLVPFGGLSSLRGRQRQPECSRKADLALQSWT